MASFYYISGRFSNFTINVTNLPAFSARITIELFIWGANQYAFYANQIQRNGANIPNIRYKSTLMRDGIGNLNTSELSSGLGVQTITLWSTDGIAWGCNIDYTKYL
jgi:hypothetical protein